MSSSPPVPPEGHDATSDESAERVSTAGTAAKPARRAKSRRKLRRRATGTVFLLFALTAIGLLASFLAPKPQVATADESLANADMIAAGKLIYETSCITCHGQNLQGVPDVGPSLIGVGDASVYFQVSSGRMPAVRGEAQVQRKPVEFTQSQIDQLGAYVQSVGGGPRVRYVIDEATGQPKTQEVELKDPDGHPILDENGNPKTVERPIVAQDELIGPDSSIGRGSELFRLNCASCHNFTGRGGALSSGKFAPALTDVTPQQLYTAMLTGPQNMPKFSNRQLSIEEKESIIAFVRYSDTSNPVGGYGLGGFGPASEGMFMWVVGIVVLVAGAMWIGTRN